MQMKLTVQQENIDEMTEKIEALNEELVKVLSHKKNFLLTYANMPGQTGFCISMFLLFC